MTNILFIPDVQWKHGLKDNRHLRALVNFVHEAQPDHIVCAGDWWDLPSLSSHGNAKEIEGLRVKKDIEAGNEQMQLFMDGIKGVKCKKTFTMGNHEERLMRLPKERPQFEGVLGYEDFNLKGWEVIPFLQIKEIDGVHFAHYFVNTMTGKPLGGSTSNKLKTLGFSYVAGHKQCIDWYRIDQVHGKVIQGLTAGAFYLHDEAYKGPQGNPHWRGICYLSEVKDGDYDFEAIRIQTLIKRFL